MSFDAPRSLAAYGHEALLMRHEMEDIADTTRVRERKDFDRLLRLYNFAASLSDADNRTKGVYSQEAEWEFLEKELHPAIKRTYGTDVLTSSEQHLRKYYFVNDHSFDDPWGGAWIHGSLWG